VPDREVGLGRDAHESGGGGGGRSPASSPAMTVTSVAARRSSVTTWRGRSSFHNIVKYGSTILSAAGRFSQIWNSSSGFGPSRVEQREHLAVHDALARGEPLHVAAPKRAVAPSESEWSMKPRRTNVTVSKPRCGCCGKPGTVVPWYMRQPSMPAKSMPISRPASDASGPICVVAGGVRVDVVHAEQERVDGRPLEAERSGHLRLRVRFLHARRRSGEDIT
jgi:hypothetical protein